MVNCTVKETFMQSCIDTLPIVLERNVAILQTQWSAQNVPFHPNAEIALQCFCSVVPCYWHEASTVTHEAEDVQLQKHNMEHASLVGSGTWLHAYRKNNNLLSYHFKRHNAGSRQKVSKKFKRRLLTLVRSYLFGSTFFRSCLVDLTIIPHTPRPYFIYHKDLYILLMKL